MPPAATIPRSNELERLAREMTGKDDALFVPSGTMANSRR